MLALTDGRHWQLRAAERVDPSCPTSRPRGDTGTLRWAPRLVSARGRGNGALCGAGGAGCLCPPREVLLGVYGGVGQV